jgi:hypothetical protein
VASELEDREEVKDPGWYVDAVDTLQPLVASRNAARTLLTATPHPRALRQKLRAIRAKLKVEVKTAKTR